jgi:hypothetical protein
MLLDLAEADAFVQASRTLTVGGIGVQPSLGKTSFAKVHKSPVQQAARNTMSLSGSANFDLRDMTDIAHDLTEHEINDFLTGSGNLP